MVKVKEITKYIEEIAHLDLQEEWDNSGIQICEDQDRVVSKVAVALDCDHSIIDNLDCDFLITHHPLIAFNPPMSIQGNLFRMVEYFIKNNISVYSSHTSFDNTLMNLALIEEIFKDFKYKILNIETKGKVVELEEPMDFELFMKKLNIDIEKSLRKEEVRRIGIMGGSGFSPEFADSFKASGVDIIISGDLTHHNAQHIDALGMGAVDINHTAEMIGMIKLSEMLQEKFPEVKFSLIKPKKYWG